MLITATRPFPYGRRDMRAGDSADVPGRDARLLVISGKARYGTRVEKPVGPPNEYFVAHEEVEAPKRKRRKRKDAEAAPEIETAPE